MRDVAGSMASKNFGFRNSGKRSIRKIGFSKTYFRDNYSSYIGSFSIVLHKMVWGCWQPPSMADDDGKLISKRALVES